MGPLIERMIRAAKLDSSLYEEVEKEQESMKQAVTVVLLSALAGGIGSFATEGIPGLIVGTIVMFLGWYLWAFVIYLAGTKILPEPQTKSDLGELLRTLGFASSPGVLRVFGLIPGMQIILYPIVAIWILVAMIVAVRQALDYSSTGRAIAVCLVGWLIQFGISFLLILLANFVAPAEAI